MKDSFDNELLKTINRLQLEKDILISDIDIKKYTEEYNNMTLEERNEFRIKILEEIIKKDNLLNKSKTIYFKSKFKNK